MDSTKKLAKERYFDLLSKHPALLRPSNAAFALLQDNEAIEEAEKVAAERLSRKGFPLEWSHVGMVAEDQYIVVLRDAVKFPNGAYGTYVRIIEKPIPGHTGVAILALKNDHILLEHHYRHATGTWEWEIPRGFIDSSESSEQAARRELAEELDATVIRIEPLGEMTPNSGLFSGRVHIVCAHLESYGIPELGEGISHIIEVSAQEFDSMVLSGNITDAFSICAKYLARLRGITM